MLSIKIRWGLIGLAMLAAATRVHADPLQEAAIHADGGVGSANVAGASASGLDKYALARSDRIRIRFLDRTDLEVVAGEYTIDETGSLRLPRLGVYDAENKTVSELETAIREGVEKRGERLGDFIIEVVGYRPVYVVGYVRNPGAFNIQPGATVLQAFSLAGGLYRSESVAPADSMRERATLAEGVERLKELYARRARLEAERDGSPDIKIPEELAQLDVIRAGDAVAREREVLERTRANEKREMASLEELIDLTQKEIDSYVDMQKAMDARLNEQTKLFERLKDLQEKQLINQQRFYEMAVSLDTTQRDRQLAIASLANARAKLGRAKRDLEVVTMASQSRIAREYADVQSEISRVKAVVIERQKLIANLDSMSDPGRLDAAVRFNIMRRGKNGDTTVLDAHEVTPVQPGDVVRVMRDTEQLMPGIR